MKVLDIEEVRTQERHLSKRQYTCQHVKKLNASATHLPTTIFNSSGIEPASEKSQRSCGKNMSNFKRETERY